MSMMSYLTNSLLLPPPLPYPKKVVYLPLLHHTCSLKLNTGKVIQPYLQPFLPTGYEGLYKASWLSEQLVKKRKEEKEKCGQIIKCLLMSYGSLHVKIFGSWS